MQGQVARIVDGDFRELEPAGRQDEVADLSRSINHMCVQLREMQRTIRETERSRLLAQFAAGSGPSTAERADGGPDERAAPRPPASRAGRRPEPGRRPAATGDDRGAGQGVALARASRAAAARRPATSRRSSRTSPSWLTRRASMPGSSSRIARGGEPLEVVVDLAGVRAALLNLTLNAIEAAGPGGAVRLEA